MSAAGTGAPVHLGDEDEEKLCCWAESRLPLHSIGRRWTPFFSFWHASTLLVLPKKFQKRTALVYTYLLNTVDGTSERLGDGFENSE
jgi:hypothetical protein